MVEFISIIRKDSKPWDGTEIVLARGKAIIEHPFDLKYTRNGVFHSLEFEKGPANSDGSSTPLGLRKSRTKCGGCIHDRFYRDTAIQISRSEADSLFKQILRNPVYTYSESPARRKALAFVFWIGVRCCGWLYFRKR